MDKKKVDPGFFVFFLGFTICCSRSELISRAKYWPMVSGIRNKQC